MKREVTTNAEGYGGIETDPGFKPESVSGDAIGIAGYEEWCRDAKGT